MQFLVDKKQFDNPYWLLMIVKFGKSIEGMANGFMNYFKQFNVNEKVMRIKTKITKEFISDNLSKINRNTIQLSNQNEQDYSMDEEYDDYSIEDFCDEIDLFNCLYETVQKYYLKLQTNPTLKQQYQQEIIICEEIIFTYFTTLSKLYDISNNTLDIMNSLQNTVTLLSQFTFHYEKNWFTEFSIDDFLQTIQKQKTYQVTLMNQMKQRNPYQQMNQITNVQYLQIMTDISPYLEEQTIIISQIVELFQSSQNVEILKKALIFFTNNLTIESVELYEGLEWLSIIVSKGIQNNQIVSHFCNF